METIFVIEKPGDEYWNVGHWSHDDDKPYPVIEAEVIVRDEAYPGQHPIDRIALRVIGPERIAKGWPTLSPRFFVKIEGPLRNLTSEEYKAIFPDPGRGWSAELIETIQAVIADLNAND